MSQKKPEDWDVAEVCLWLSNFRNFFGKKTTDIVKAFRKHEIDGEVLLTYISPEEIRKELGIETAGHCRRLIMEIDRLRGGTGRIATPFIYGAFPPLPSPIGGERSPFLLKPPPPPLATSERLAPESKEPSGADLFISYSHADTTLALRLKKELESNGLVCWMDTHLKTGDDWEMQLEENLTFSKAVVALISPNYEISESCRNEVRLSLNRGKRIFPVLVETLKKTPRVPLPDDHWPPHGYGFALARTQYNDFRKDWLLMNLLRDLEAYGVRHSSGIADGQFSGRWKEIGQDGEIPCARFGCAFFNFGNFTVLYGGTTYKMSPEKQEIVEHNDVHLLNNETMVWTQEKTSGQPHPSGYGCSALLCGEGTMICIGGGNYMKSYNDVTLLDFTSFEWHTPLVEGTPPETRYGHTATLVNKKVYVFGGRQGEQYFNDLYVLDISQIPEKVTWSKVESSGTPPSPRYQSTTALVGGHLLVYGGSKINETNIDHGVYSFELRTNTWTQVEVKGEIPLGRRQHSAVLIGHKLIFFGGKGVQKSLSEIVVLDTQEKTWDVAKVEGKLPEARGLHAAVQRGNQLLVFAGLSDVVVREFDIPGKGTERQLLHLQDLCVLEISSA